MRRLPVSLRLEANRLARSGQTVAFTVGPVTAGHAEHAYRGTARIGPDVIAGAYMDLAPLTPAPAPTPTPAT